MITASELAGHFAAHTVWTLSESDTFNPIFAYTSEDDARHMQRLIAPTPQEAIAFGRQRLESTNGCDGVLLFDGRIKDDDGGKLDAIIIEMRCYIFPRTKATIAVPYTGCDPGPFRVHRPKLLEWHECDDFDIDAAFEAFFRGVDSHEQGSAVWNASLDQSK